MKKLFASLLAGMMILTGCGTGDSSTTGETKDLSEVKIGVVQLMQHTALDATYEGFKDVLVEAGVKEENINYQVPGEDNIATSADSMVNGGYDLIYAIATPAVQAVDAAADDSLPIVGCAVTDYVEVGLAASNEAPGGNVTGASDLTPIAQQFDLLTQILPDAKNVAIVYCGSEPNSVIQGNTAEEAAKAKGLNTTVYTVTDQNNVTAVMEKIVADKVDVIYIPTDNLLANNMNSVAEIASGAKIPTIVGEDGMCQNGGMATYGINYYNLGKVAGQQALKILRGEATPAEMPIEFLPAEECAVTINLKTAEKCGITINKADYPDASFIE